MVKVLLLGIILVALALAFSLVRCIPFDDEDLATEESLWNLYERWRSHHTVSRDLDGKYERFDVFVENVKFIHEFNKKDDASYKLSLNKFGDMTNEEFRRWYAGSKVQHHKLRRGSLHGDGRSFMHENGSFMHENAHNFPALVDWRQKGAVTGIKDQGQCGKRAL